METASTMSRGWLWTPVVLITVAGLSYGLYRVLQPSPLPQGLLYGNGHIEATEVVVSAEVAGTVVENRMVEGRPVRQGDLLVRLDDTELRIRLAQAEAQAGAVRRGTTALAAQLETWRHHLATAESDLDRFRELRARGTVSPRQLSEVEDSYRDARGRVDVLEAQITEAGARLRAAEQQVALLQRQVDKTEIRAPVGATIESKAIETGELATPGRAVAVLVELSRPELKVYIPEGDIGKVKLGDSARVKVDTFPDYYFQATVSRVDQRAQFTPRDVHLPEERVRRVFGVILTLDNPEGRLKPGMPADAWIRWRDETPWPQRLAVPR